MLSTLGKLEILADAAKYDASCASSGAPKARLAERQGIGSTSNGICHSYTPDGRCVSLLKILLTNACIFDCAYCINRRSSTSGARASALKEVVDLTLNFYKPQLHRGAVPVVRHHPLADYTMELLVRVAREPARGARLPRLHPPQEHSRTRARR